MPNTIFYHQVFGDRATYEHQLGNPYLIPPPPSSEYFGCSVIGSGYPTWLDLLRLLRLPVNPQRGSNTQGSLSKILTETAAQI
jgi:hypothetical protein